MAMTPNWQKKGFQRVIPGAQGAGKIRRESGKAVNTALGLRKSRSTPPGLRKGMPLEVDQATAKQVATIRAGRIVASPLPAPVPVSRQPGAFPRVVGPREAAMRNAAAGPVQQPALRSTAVRPGQAFRPHGYVQRAQPINQASPGDSALSSSAPGVSLQEMAIATASDDLTSPQLLPAPGLIQGEEAAVAKGEAGLLASLSALSTPTKFGLAALAAAFLLSR